MSDLGPLVRVHGPDHVGFGCVAIIGLLAAAFVPFGLRLALIGAWDGLVGVLLDVAMMAGALALAVWAGARLVGARGTTWAVHERGLRITLRGRADDVPWDDVREVVIRVRLDKDPLSYTLYSVATAERRWRFYNLETDDADELAAAVADHTRDRLAAGILAGVDRGEWVELGEIGLSRAGLRWGNELVPWSDVRLVHRESLCLRPELADGRQLRAVFLDDVPNGHVLPGLLDALAARDRVTGAG